MAELQTGEMITPSLKLVRHLGTGGMGTVWVARHLGLNSDVVVKFITGDFARNAEAVARFQREAGAASEVRSPHVVQVFDYGIAQNGLPYIAMEFLEGEDLAALLERRRILSPGEVAGVVNQVARALGRAHEKRIIHRDIKPENIFLCETGEEEAFVKVLDFGIAKIAGDDQLAATATGAMIGTAFFMSPEQVMGSKAIDHRTDLWSLGVLAFYAMTGVRPFDGETIGALSVRICGGDYPKPSRYNSKLSPAIDAWFATACARDPSARFPTARVMADALIQAVGGPQHAKILSQDFFSEEPTQVAHAAMLGPGPAARAKRSDAPPAARPIPPTLLHVAQPALLASTTTGASAVSALDASSTSAAHEAPRRRRLLIPLLIGGAVVAGLAIGGVASVLATHDTATETAPASAKKSKKTKSDDTSTESSQGTEPAASASESAAAVVPEAAPSSSRGRPVPLAAAQSATTTSASTTAATRSSSPPTPSAKPTNTSSPKPTSTIKAKPTYEPLE